MVIVLTGPNSFAIRRALAEEVERFASVHGAHSIEHVDGEALTPDALPSLLQGATLFAAEHLVLLRGSASNKALWEALGDWAERVPASTTLVIVEPVLDKRTKTYKALKKTSDFREYPVPSEPELLKWLQTTATQLGATLSADTARFLLQRTGSDQQTLWQELRKLVSYQPLITKETITMLVEPSPQASVFELLDAALAHKPRVASALLAELRTSEDPYKLFGLLVSQVHTLAVVHYAGAKNAETVAQESGLHPFVVRKMRSTAQGMERQQLQAIIAAVAQLDSQLKSTGGDPWMLLEQSLSKIATS